jgi:hypothetical protein
VIWITLLSQPETYIWGQQPNARPFHSFEDWHMTYPALLLSDLLVGWQKVADRYNMPIYVFQTGDAYHAVSNEAQGVGHLVNTLAPQVQLPKQVDRSKSNIIVA